jgi:polysaccharide export outer membrane protein
MNRVVICGLLLAIGLAACSVPSTGPLREQLLHQAKARGGQPRHFDVVTVNQRVVDTLQMRPQPLFRERFKKYEPPPELPIAIGDVLSVTIWESSADGLFGQSLGAQAFTAKDLIARAKTAGVFLPPGGDRSSTLPEVVNDLKMTALGQSFLQEAAPTGRPGSQMPDQRVGPDGAISIPYAGRIEAAGRTAGQVQQLIQGRLAATALDPQVLVVVKQSDLNSATITGEAVRGQRVRLAPGGSRLLDVIAAAGGPQPPPPSPPEPPMNPPITAITLPVASPWGVSGAVGVPITPTVPGETPPPLPLAALRDMFVELSRDGVTASIPYATLVDSPDEDVYARPGDVITLVRRPQVISVFGATGKNAAVAFDADRVSLSEALAKAGGLADNAADPQAVFLLRYEPVSVVSALGAPVDPGTRAGLIPVAYRLDLSNAASYALAKRFFVRDKDVVYVADAESLPIQKIFTVIDTLTQPIVNGLVSCGASAC